MAEPMEQARSTVANLVERFRSHLGTYRSSAYHETEVRVEYIDPFFEALGWDVHNQSGYSDAYKDVVHEESMRSAASVAVPTPIPNSPPESPPPTMTSIYWFVRCTG